jgi:cellulose/xylan binding protein with CBM9 domain
MRLYITWALGLGITAPAAAIAQAVAQCWAPPPPVGALDTTRDRAARARRIAVATPVTEAPPRIDGRLDDPIWCAAPPLTDFVQSGPNPGALATLPTVARVLFDDDAVYVAVRLFDPAPDSIVAPFPRRDNETTSDWVFLEIDSRFDRRSGFSFGVNPRGVQVDGTWANDVDYDAAWNGVWTSAARIDSLGWTVEYRIDYSQLALGRSRGVSMCTATPRIGANPPTGRRGCRASSVSCPISTSCAACACRPAAPPGSSCPTAP